MAKRKSHRQAITIRRILRGLVQSAIGVPRSHDHAFRGLAEDLVQSRLMPGYSNSFARTDRYSALLGAAAINASQNLNGFFLNSDWFRRPSIRLTPGLDVSTIASPRRPGRPDGSTDVRGPRPPLLRPLWPPELRRECAPPAPSIGARPLVSESAWSA